MMDSSGGFSEELFGAALGVSSCSGLDHASVMVEVLRMPFRALEGRPSLMMEGAWMAEYGLVASRPAYLYITGARGQHEVEVGAGDSRLTPWSTRMVWRKACDVPYLPTDYYPTVGVGVVLGYLGNGQEL
jgi:hypothetical protein